MDLGQSPADRFQGTSGGGQIAPGHHLIVLVDEDQSIEVLTEPTEFESVRDAMAGSGLEPEAAQLTMRASTNAALGVKEATSMIKLLEVLEDLDDVQEVYSNADISDDLLAQI